MPIFRMNAIIISSFLAVSALVYSGSLFAIAKCQDAQGKWHYGDTANEACGDSTITIIDNSGRTIEEVAPPMTERERIALEEELKRLEEEDKLEMDRERERARILAIYPSTESIQRAKEAKLSGQDNNIKIQEKLLDNLRQEVRNLEKKKPVSKKGKADLAATIKLKQDNFEDYYKSIGQLRREREETVIKYDEILQEYADLTSGTGDPQVEKQARDRKLERNRRITQIREQLGLNQSDPK